MSSQSHHHRRHSHRRRKHRHHHHDPILITPPFASLALAPSDSSRNKKSDNQWPYSAPTTRYRTPRRKQPANAIYSISHSRNPHHRYHANREPLRGILRRPSVKPKQRDNEILNSPHRVSFTRLERPTSPSRNKEDRRKTNATVDRSGDKEKKRRSGTSHSLSSASKSKHGSRTNRHRSTH